MLDRCPVHEAELDYDIKHGLTYDEENKILAAQEAYWIRCVNDLLAGKTIEENCKKYNLAERLADEYHDFCEFVNDNFDFMEAFKNGTLYEKYASVVKAEAKTLASIIVG